jgi:hypothetical protein
MEYAVYVLVIWASVTSVADYRASIGSTPNVSTAFYLTAHCATATDV